MKDFLFIITPVKLASSKEYEDLQLNSNELNKIAEKALNYVRTNKNIGSEYGIDNTNLKVKDTNSESSDSIEVKKNPNCNNEHSTNNYYKTEQKASYEPSIFYKDDFAKENDISTPSIDNYDKIYVNYKPKKEDNFTKENILEENNLNNLSYSKAANKASEQIINSRSDFKDSSLLNRSTFNKVKDSFVNNQQSSINNKKSLETLIDSSDSSECQAINNKLSPLLKKNVSNLHKECTFNNTTTSKPQYIRTSEPSSIMKCLIEKRCTK